MGIGRRDKIGINVCCGHTLQQGRKPLGILFFDLGHTCSVFSGDNCATRYRYNNRGETLNVQSACRREHAMTLLRWLILCGGGVVLLGVFGTLYMVCMPGRSHTGLLPPLTSAEAAIRQNLVSHVWMLA